MASEGTHTNRRLRVMLQCAVEGVRDATRNAVAAFRVSDVTKLHTSLLDGARTAMGCRVHGATKEAAAALDATYAFLLRVADPGNLLQRSFYDKFKKATDAAADAPSSSTCIAECHAASDMNRMVPQAGTFYSEFVHLLQHACAEAAANIVTKALDPDAGLPFPERPALEHGVARLRDLGYYGVADKLQKTCVSEEARLVLVTALVCLGM
jgi:hypothetical protein